jgi:hypothetical protein
MRADALLALRRPPRLALLALLGGTVFLGRPAPGEASSHSDAPLISGDRAADNSDLFFFRSYQTGASDRTVLVDCFWPMQDPAAGPNFHVVPPTVVHEIHVDSNRDGREDLTFQFQFQTEYRAQTIATGTGVNVSIPFVVSGPVSSVADPNLNVVERFTVTLIQGDRRTGTRIPLTHGGGNPLFVKPMDNIGPSTFPNYAAYAAQHVLTTDPFAGTHTGRVFVGQRREGFIVELGGVFDRMNVTGPNQNSLRYKNVTAIGLELPTALLTNDGANPVIGAWCSSSRRQARILNPVPARTLNAGTVEGGSFTQVSRLGLPLVNELVIGLSSKDRFNGSEPKDDAQFEGFFLNSSLAATLNVLIPTLGAPTGNRLDIREICLEGGPYALFGGPPPPGFVPSEMLRLNTLTPPTPLATQSSLGALGGDPAGFPNGRRPFDDVTDIVLRVVAGALHSPPNPNASQATDQVGPIRAEMVPDFPFLATPLSHVDVPGPCK